MSAWKKVGPGRYKHQDHEAYLYYSFSTSRWHLDFAGHHAHGQTFHLRKHGQEIAVPAPPKPKLEPVSTALTLQDYYLAPGGKNGLSPTWDDKPHRLVYDLVKEVVKCHDIMMNHGILEDRETYQCLPLYELDLTKYKV